MDTDSDRFKHGEITQKIIVLLELKAVRCLDSSHEAQLLNYLRATDIEVGLLLNFGLKPQFKRLIFDNARKLSHRSARMDTDKQE